jgi:hypothetical protein
MLDQMGGVSASDGRHHVRLMRVNRLTVPVVDHCIDYRGSRPSCGVVGLPRSIARPLHYSIMDPLCGGTRSVYLTT